MPPLVVLQAAFVIGLIGLVAAGAAVVLLAARIVKR